MSAQPKGFKRFPWACDIASLGGAGTPERLEGEADVHIDGSKTQEFWIDTGAGRVFAKTWNFDGIGDAGKAPIILFHQFAWLRGAVA